MEPSRTVRFSLSRTTVVGFFDGPYVLTADRMRTTAFSLLQSDLLGQGEISTGSLLPSSKAMESYWDSKSVTFKEAKVFVASFALEGLEELFGASDKVVEANEVNDELNAVTLLKNKNMDWS